MSARPRVSLLIALAVLGLVVGVVRTGVHAQQSSAPPPRDGMRIGFVDIELVIENSRALRRGLDTMDEQLAERARVIDRREREFRRLRFELDNQERLITTEDRARRRAELADIQDDINRLRFEFEEEMRSKERLIEPVLEKVMNIVADVAERDGFDLVLRGEVVIYGVTSADMTSAVIAELDGREDSVVNLFRGGTRPQDGATSPALGTERPLRPRPTGDLLPLVP
ncbi:MAG: OmpH family outer membrane protein [Candidatus Sumerlaeia bacterium]|nr:OmpH family outer membrane protein [Candidatus Sumerlaeia bacterium]